MRAFLWNLFLAAVWGLAWGSFSLQNLAIGFLLGYVMLCLTSELLDAKGYCKRLPRLIEFVLFFIWELVLANFRLAYDILTPQHRMRPGIIAVPLDVETDVEILLLANTISLTPGTLSLDISPDRKTLYLHSMYIDDVEKEKMKIKRGFESRLLRLLR